MARRPLPLGAQRRPVREGKNMLRGDRNVGIVRQAAVTCCNRDGVGERDARRDERDWRSTAAVPKTRTLGAALRRRIRAWRGVMSN